MSSTKIAFHARGLDPHAYCSLLKGTLLVGYTYLQGHNWREEFTANRSGKAGGKKVAICVAEDSKKTVHPRYSGKGTQHGKNSHLESWCKLMTIIFLK